MSRAGFVVALKAECGSLTQKRLRMGDCIDLEGGSLMMLSGVGPDAAGRAAERLLAEGADTLVSWGCAAALDTRLKPGSLILASHVLEQNGVARRTDDVRRNALVASLNASRVDVHQLAVVESERIVATPDAKAELLQRSGGQAVDMESGAVARCAVRNNIPLLVVRAIADTATMAVPVSVMSATDTAGNVSLPVLLRHVCINPLEIAALIRLGRHFSAAMRTLRKVSLHIDA